MERGPEAQALYNRYYQFGLETVRPEVRTHDDAHSFNRAAWQRLGEADFFRLPIAAAQGGLGHSLPECAAALEGLVEGSSDLGFSVSTVAHWVCLLSLQEFGSDGARKNYMPRMLSGEWVGAVANAEPQAGTNLMALTSHAVKTANGFELHAGKNCITNVGVADVMLVSARLRDVSTHRALNVFALEASAAGVETRVLTDLAGLRTSCTGDVTAQAVPLAAEALLGGIGRGLRIFRTMFVQERLWTGVLYLAALSSCLRRALTHAESRLQFGRPIGRNQYVQDRIIRMRVAEQLLRALLSNLLDGVERGDDVLDTLSVIKIHGVEAAIEASEDLMRLLGGRGMGKHETAEKFHRDLLALSILGGTVELQKITLYQELVRRRAGELSALQAKGTEVNITLHQADAMEPALERTLVDLTARLFPGEAALAGRYYYDTPPDWVLVAWKDTRLAGFLVIPRRQIEVGGSRVNVAGIGLGIEPDLQRHGIGTALLRRALELLREWGDDLAVAILFSANAEKLFHAFGFRKLQAQVTHMQRASGQLTTETMPVLALDVNFGSLVDDIDALGRLHLGVGTW